MVDNQENQSHGALDGDVTHVFTNATIDRVGSTTTYNTIIQFPSQAQLNPDAGRGLTPANTNPFSIDNVCEPLGDLQVTGTFNITFDKVKDKNKCALICYGVPGSGKSQLVRSLARKFPYRDVRNIQSATSDDSSSSHSIKWHIQCKDTGDDLKKEFLRLAEKLQENRFIEINRNSVEEDFRKNQSKALVKMLMSCRIPVLIIIEDPTSASGKFLQSFFQSLSQGFQNTSDSKFHVYFTSRSKWPLLSKSLSSIEYHETININGFSEDEAIRFLQQSDGTTDTREDLIKVFKRFSGLPLGLLAAKGFCHCTGLTYKKYLMLVDDYSYDILLHEKEAIEMEYGESAEHVFQAIVMPFFPGDGTSTGVLFWKVLRCISFFHYDRIPRFLLDHCCHVVRENKIKNPELRNEADVGMLIKKLSEYGMCTKTPDGAVTFHEVVLNAFRLKQQQSLLDFNPLKKAIESICGLVSLDLRRQENSSRMYKLRPHLQTLLKHVEKNMDMLESDEDFLLVQAVTSHLYQVVAAVLLSESYGEESDAMFRKSFEKIWPEMKEVTLPQSKASDEIALEVVQKSEAKAQHLPKDFIVQYSSWIVLSHFEKDELTFLRSESKKNCEEIEKLLKSMGSKRALVEELRECQLFLPDNIYLPIFYAERFASIMHSWSRHFLFSECDQAMKKCLWLNSLSNAISTCVTASSGISLLTEWLSQIAGLIPLLLKLKDEPNSLKRAQELCQDMIKNHELKMYENGLIKKVFSPPTLTRISLLRYMVRINARLVKSSDNSFLLGADETCEQLFQLATENINSSNSLAYVIYCGKYYAAKRDFVRALTCFKKFFELSSMPNLKPRFYIECWAVYNYSRTVCCESSTQEKEDAVRKCKDVLDSNKFIQDDLKQHLANQLTSLEALLPSSS